MTSLREIAKALAAFFSALAAALSAGAATSEGLNAGGTLVALIGATAAGLLTFTIPNASPTGTRRAVEDVPLTFYDPKTGAKLPPEEGTPR